MNDQDNTGDRYPSLRTIFALSHNVVDLAGQLQTAIQTRSVIEQATGILMAENHCTSEDALAILTRLSANENAQLSVIAQTLVSRTA